MTLKLKQLSIVTHYGIVFQYGTATGSCGTISWQVEGLKLRLIVMWSVPFNLAIHKSYLAIGMVYNEGRFSSAGM